MFYVAAFFGIRRVRFPRLLLRRCVAVIGYMNAELENIHTLQTRRKRWNRSTDLILF